MTEKRQPSYKLELFKTAAGSRSDFRVTATAIKGAAALGFGRKEMVAVIQGMKHDHFYKSMTGYSDHRVWQDVYHVPSRAGVLYIKFTRDAVTAFLLLSFKAKDDD